MRRAKFAPRAPLALNPQAFGLELLFGSEPDRAPKTVGDVAVVEVIGPLMHHVEWCWDSYDAIKARVSDALASSARAVVLSIDSPGGLVSGCIDTVRELRAMSAAAGKPIYSYVDGESTSAAFALACAGERIFVPSTGIVGSIGVIAMPVDTTEADRTWGYKFTPVTSGRRKADGNPHVPITDESVKAIQAVVDAQAAVLFGLVSEIRGLSVEAIRGFEAGLFVGAEAVSAGLADEIATLDETLAMVASGSLTRAGTAEESAMNLKELKAELRKMAEGEGDEAEEARKMLKALEGDGDGDEGGKDKDGDGDGQAASSAEGEGDENKDKDKDGDQAASSASSSADGTNVVELAREVHTLKAERAAEKDEKKRAEIFATRPDLDDKTRKALASVPTSSLAGVLETFPRINTPASLAAAAQAEVSPTVGKGQSAGAYTPDPDLAARMGLAPRVVKAVSCDGITQTLHALTAEEARALKPVTTPTR